MMMNKIIYPIFALVVMVATSHASNVQPDEIARSFYDVLIKSQIRGLPDEKEMDAIGQFISEELEHRIKLAHIEHDEFVRLNDNQSVKPPWTKEGNLFASMWEGMHGYKLGAGSGNDEVVSYPVYLSYSSQSGLTQWIDVLILKNTKNGWKVQNIYFNGFWPFRIHGSLLDNLPKNR